MAVNDTQLAALIKSNEGFSASKYADTRGNATSGYGFNLDDPYIRRVLPQDVVSGKRKLSPTEADFYFQKYLLPRAVSDAQSFVGPDTFSKLDAPRQHALVDMAYNLGGPRLQKFVKAKTAIQSGDFQKAASEIQDSQYFKQVPNRAAANVHTMLTGQPFTQQGDSGGQAQ